MKTADVKAFAIIDACITHLRDLEDGEIPIRWQQRFLQGAKQVKTPEPNPFDILITAEYLIGWSKSNPVLPEPASDDSPIPDEEPAPRGLLTRLAKKHDMHHSSVREIIDRTMRDHRIDTMAKAIALDLEE